MNPCPNGKGGLVQLSTNSRSINQNKRKLYAMKGKLLLMFLISLTYKIIRKSKFLVDNFYIILKSISHFRYRLSRTIIIFINVYHECIRYGYHDRQYIETVKQNQTFALRSNRWTCMISLTMKAFFCFVFTYICLFCYINLHGMVL